MATDIIGVAIGTTHNPDRMVNVTGNHNTIARQDYGWSLNEVIHTDNVYNALLNSAQIMENRLNQSLQTYQEHPDVQANLQQLQYDLQMWNLALTTMTNMQKNMSDALSSIASNFR